MTILRLKIINIGSIEYNRTSNLFTTVSGVNGFKKVCGQQIKFQNSNSLGQLRVYDDHNHDYKFNVNCGIYDF